VQSLTASITLLLLAIATGTSGQPGRIEIKRSIPDISDSVVVHHTILKEQFGQHKQTPAVFEKQMMYALSYYPELAKTRIKVQLKQSTGGIIATRPTIGSIFRRSSKRTYLIIINDSIAGRKMPVFGNSPVNGQVGILGHELCHIVYFNSHSGIGLLRLGIAHISRRYMDRFEYATDSLNIERGLGYQLLAWKRYLDGRFRAVHKEAGLPKEVSKVRNRYMSVEQIERLIARRKE
jgi:hypothetical protein